MSQENVEPLLAELWEQGMEAVKRRDVDRLVELSHPEVEWIPRRVTIEGVYRGHEGVRRFWAETFATFDDFELEAGEVRDLGADRLLIVGVIRTRGHGSGAQTRVPAAGIVEYREGLIYRWQDFLERHLALEGVGLAE